MIAEAKNAAIREAKEETGLIIKSLDHITTSHCGANIEWDLYYFVTDNFEETSDHNRDDE
jgi:8-oxo-dGTP pyrophosphatase MutT (NUDIX family)